MRPDSSTDFFDDTWQDRYRSKIRSAKRSLRRVRSGHRVFIGTGCGEPTVLVDALVARAGDLGDVELIQLFTKGNASYAKKQYHQAFRLNSFFIGENVRENIQQGLGSYTPMLLSDIPRLLNSGRLPIDVALIQTTPPNQRGQVSLGISLDIVKNVIENCSLIIAQVNPQMVWSHGESLVDIEDLDILVPVDVELLERKEKPAHRISRAIGRTIATLIPDGATLEFGLGRLGEYGRLPHAAMEFLTDKKDLGIHSEMITDDILPLIESGVITGAKKTTDRGRIVTSFCLGTKELYQKIHNNSMFCFRPTEYVNDSNIIAQQTRMIAINPAREIDLTGQVAADSQEGQLHSGIGGVVDFNRGASFAKEGKSIIALPSTDPEVTRSNIVPFLSQGSGVVITRGEVQFVVTEYGVAYLHGKSIQERAMALITIAHPDFRKELFDDAVKAHYLHPDLSEVATEFIMNSAPVSETTRLLDDGVAIRLRPIHPTDEASIRDLMYNLSQETLYYRFMSHQSTFSSRQIQDFVFVDQRKEVTIVATVEEAHGEFIIGVGRYILDEETNLAEVAFVVRDTWQNIGIGTFLFEHLCTIAKENNIAGFTARVLRENQRMQTIFNHSSLPVTQTMEEGLYGYMIELE